jgi:Flp pilus assembly protein TadD
LALRFNPSSAETHYNLGNALLQGGRLDEAITHYQLALALKPSNAEAHAHLGGALLQKGRLDEAIAHLQTALQIHPDLVAPHIHLSSAFLRKGNVAGAAAQLEQALQIEPANPGLMNNLAWVLATCAEPSPRNASRAVELATQANTLTGGQSPPVLHTLAAALASAGRFGEALETGQEALRLAEAQSNASLAGRLRSELGLYQAGKPLHSPTAPHSPNP